MEVLEEINQKIDKLLEFQEKQARLAKIKFWINFGLIFCFVILPLFLLPFAIKSMFASYSQILNVKPNENTSLNSILELFQ